MPGNWHRQPALLRRLLCLALLFLPLAATAWAPPYPIIDTTERASLGLFIAWHEDPGGRERLADVAALPPSAFTVSDSDRLHFGYSRSTWWFRVSLQNTHDTPETLLLEVPHPSLSLIEFYRPAADGYAVTRSGTASERVIGDFDHQNYLFGITVPAGATETYWFRVRSDLALDFSLGVEKPEAFTHEQSVAQILAGVFVGILLGLLVYNAIAWGVTRQPEHAWYVLFLLWVVAFLLARQGYLGVLFFRQAGMHSLIETVSALVATFAGLQFVRALLDTRRQLPALDPWLRHLAVAGLVAVVATPFMDAWQRGPMYTMYAALVMPTTLYAAWLAARQHYPDAQRYLVARMASAVAGGLATAAELGYIALPFASSGLLVVSASIEASLIAWMLYLRQARNRVATDEARRATEITAAESRARSEFLDRFSHDVRTPLNGILGMTELLVDTSLTPRQREYTLTIRGAGENLLALLNEALDWTRLETGQLAIQHSDFDLAHLVAESIETVQLRAEEKHIELVVDIDPRVPAQVNGDPARLRQVLCNLLGNAVRFTHRGEVQVHVVPGVAPGLVRIEVRDTGIGIPRERLAQLLDRTVRQGMNASDGSHGFGLLIARQLVDRMDGRLGATSEEHRGSTFWIELPLPPTPSQAIAADTAILRGKRLLVVDDNAAVRRVIETQAADWGMTVTVADNGQEALAVARTQANLGASFDVVVVDHNMPGMSGLQLAARIKEDPLIRHDAVIIMLTGLNIAPTETMARNVGIRRVLTKPVSGRTLQSVLAEELARRERFEPEEPALPTQLPENLRVLVAEDHHLSQKVIRGMLAKLGVRSDVVGNGQEALDAVQNHRYDLVLMDCEMPVLDGYEATRRIRAWETDNARRRIPIIALSAHIMNEIKERCRQSGMDAHMAKPVDLNELRETLRVYAADVR